MSRPLQVYLEDDDLARLEAWSRARGWTKSQAVRVAVRALVAPSDDPLAGLSGMLDGLPSDMAENFDRYLNETFVAEKAPRYRGRRASRARVRR
jgi:hypothetical protein